LRFLVVCLFAVIFSLPAAAARALPAAFGAWHSTPAQAGLAPSLDSVSAANAPFLREYGFLGVERVAYGAANGRQLTATLYRMRDASAAYGAYTLLRTAGMATSDIGEKSAVSRERLLVVEGNLLLDVAGPGAASLADLKILVEKIASAAEMAPYPEMWEYLPIEGLVPASDHYIVGPATLEHLIPRSSIRANGEAKAAPINTLGPGSDWLGFADGAEVEIATYRLRGESVELVLAHYPTRQLATKHLETMGKLFAVNPPPSASRLPSDSLPAMFVVRKIALLAIVLGARSPAIASSLIQQVRYETSVTWNEPSWKFTEKPFVKLLFDVFVGTGVILVYAFVASIAFGLIRLLIKRTLPNRVFDRPGQIEVLQIGIYSKPIEAKDFYSDEPPH
jgi:hypothetical protein